MKFKVMFNFLLKQMYSDRRGNGQKPSQTKTSRQKTPWQNPSHKNPREPFENLHRGFCPAFLY